ncbi:hypothetical protein BCR39DRAFT_484197, partial [Naematelia encephala]
MRNYSGIPEIDEASCVKALQQIVQIKSYSRTDGEINVTNHIAAEMRAVGLDAATHPFDGGKRQNAVGVWKGSGGGKSLLFNGHVDTNPATEGWTVDPWGGLVKDGMIYGIGVSNMKSGCAAYFCAVKTLKEAGWQPKGDIILTYAVGELQGGVGTAAMIEQGLCNADYFVNCEPTDLKAITMHAESFTYRIELTGVTRHMSKREEGVDVLLVAADLIPRVDATIFPNARNADVKACNRCHVGSMRAGLGRDMLEWRPPQVADFAVLRGSARIGPGQTEKDAVFGLNQACEETAKKFPGLQYKVIQEDIMVMPSFEVEKDAYIVRELNKAYTSVRPDEAQPTGALEPQCFYGSDAGHLYKKLKLQGIVCGPGGKYNTMPDERVELTDYLDCVRMFIRVIIKVCG